MEVQPREEIHISVTDLSNSGQIISSIFLLKIKQLQILQICPVKRFLCTVLLILGCSIFLDGLDRISQSFNLDMAYISANLLSFAATSLPIPTASSLWSQSSAENIVRQSSGGCLRVDFCKHYGEKKRECALPYLGHLD